MHGKYNAEPANGQCSATCKARRGRAGRSPQQRGRRGIHASMDPVCIPEGGKAGGGFGIEWRADFTPAHGRGQEAHPSQGPCPSGRSHPVPLLDRRPNPMKTGSEGGASRRPLSRTQHPLGSHHEFLDPREPRILKLYSGNLSRPSVRCQKILRFCGPQTAVALERRNCAPRLDAAGPKGGWGSP